MANMSPNILISKVLLKNPPERSAPNSRPEMFLKIPQNS